MVKEEIFGLFGWAREGEPTGEERGSGARERGRTREQEVAGGLPARRWERRGKREDGAGSGGRAKGEGVQPERAEQRGASEGRRQPPGRGAGLWSTAARGLEPF